MSTFVCPHCGQATDVFKRGGGERTAEVLGCPFLGRVPLEPAIVESGDKGVPIVVAQPEGLYSEAFGSLAEAVATAVSKQQARRISIF